MATSDREVLWDRIVAFMEEEKILAPARLLSLAARLLLVHQLVYLEQSLGCSCQLWRRSHGLGQP